MGSRKRKKRNRKPFQPSKTFEDAGVHLPSFIAGMVTTVLLMLLIWNQFVISDSKQRALAAVESTDSDRNVDDKTFESILKNGTAEELYRMLLGANSWSRKTPVPQQIHDNQQRVDLANQMLTLSLTEEQRELAIESKIRALAVIYGLDLEHDLAGPNVAETLNLAAIEFSKDSNQRVARTARIAKLKHDTFESRYFAGQLDVDTIAAQIIELLKDYPDDDMLISTVRQIVKIYRLRGNEALALIQKIKDGAGDLDSPKVMALIFDLSDRAKIQALNYQQEYDNRWVNGRLGKQKLATISLELLSDPTYGELICRQVDAVTHWFEQENDYETAVEIYRKMLVSADQNERPEVARIARETAEFGLTRQKLVKQKIEFVGVMPNGKSLDPSVFAQRVVIVLFWSADQPESVETLKEVSRNTDVFRAKGGRMLAVAVNPEPGNELESVLGPTSPGVYHAVNNAAKDRENLIWDKCPSNFQTRAMLVDRDGVVVDINVPISEIKTEAEFLLSK